MNPVVRFSLLGCILFGLGIYFYTQWELKRFEESLPKAPQLVSSTTATTAENENAVTPTENAQDGHENDGASHAAPPTVVAKPLSQREQIAVDNGTAFRRCQFRDFYSLLESAKDCISSTAFLKLTSLFK